MQRLTVLYDVRCALCRRARAWLEQQALYVELEFVAAGSPEARERFPLLDHEATLEELTVVDDTGGLYRGARGWLMCLWALRDYRAWSYRLASPTLLPLAQRFFLLVSSHRFLLGAEPPPPEQADGALVCRQCRPLQRPGGSALER